jgi:hypothetical protein
VLAYTRLRKRTRILLSGSWPGLRDSSMQPRKMPTCGITCGELFRQEKQKPSSYPHGCRLGAMSAGFYAAGLLASGTHQSLFIRVMTPGYIECSIARASSIGPLPGAFGQCHEVYCPVRAPFAATDTHGRSHKLLGMLPWIEVFCSFILLRIRDQRPQIRGDLLGRRVGDLYDLLEEGCKSSNLKWLSACTYEITQGSQNPVIRPARPSFVSSCKQHLASGLCEFCKPEREEVHLEVQHHKGLFLALPTIVSSLLGPHEPVGYRFYRSPEPKQSVFSGGIAAHGRAGRCARQQKQLPRELPPGKRLDCKGQGSLASDPKP